MRRLTPLILAAALGAAAASAQAATLYTDVGPSAQTASPGAIDVTFAGGAGAGLATFDIDGYLSLDGAGDASIEDLFTLRVNGADVYSAYFPLGGAGALSVILAPSGATETYTNNGFFGGGSASLSIPVVLQEGSNTVTFAYSGVAQGLGDEAWAISNVSITGNLAAPPAAGSAPEPGAWALMIGGFFGLGATLRTRRRSPPGFARRAC
jgi:hypothetical protein